MPENIKRHSSQVAKVADAVAEHIEKQGVEINKELINRGALLHDIAKIIAVNTNAEDKHATMGAEITEEENLGSEITEIIRKHYLTGFSGQCTLEELVVNYADKRVKHDEIVSLEERFSYILKNYPRAVKAIEEKEQIYFEFEKKYQINQLGKIE
ncbi:HDIG domain-containing protein [Patescibacteria group bacterium]|nr:HDIG domain-containing protein [Patescibacteria group bacterium]